MCKITTLRSWISFDSGFCMLSWTFSSSSVSSHPDQAIFFPYVTTVLKYLFSDMNSTWQNLIWNHMALKHSLTGNRDNVYVIFQKVQYLQRTMFNIGLSMNQKNQNLSEFGNLIILHYLQWFRILKRSFTSNVMRHDLLRN